MLGTLCGFPSSALAQTEIEPERRALARRALHPHRAAVCLGDRAADEKSEPEPTRDLGRARRAVIAFEDAFEVLGTDARTVIGHLDAHAVAGQAHPHLDRRAL